MCDVTDKMNDVTVNVATWLASYADRSLTKCKCQFCHKALSSHVDESKPQTNLTLYWIHVFTMFYMRYACILGMYTTEF